MENVERPPEAARHNAAPTNKKPPHPEEGPEVTITVNNVPKLIHRGRRTVAEIKTVGGVPQADDLAQVIEGKLLPLPDNDAVTIKGREVFVSHPKDSASA
jgi:hypothetical protein